MLKEQHGIVVADGGLQQRGGVGGIGGCRDLEARDAGEEAFERLRVGGAVAAAAAGRGADDERAGASVDRVELGGHIDELVDGQRDEIHEHDFDHGTLPRDRRADRDTGQRLFGDRGVTHALAAEFIDQPARDTERAAVDADILAHQKDRGIAPQFGGQGFAKKLCEGDRAHDGRKLSGKGERRRVRRTDPPAMRPGPAAEKIRRSGSPHRCALGPRRVGFWRYLR
ncbi:MAG: hypothetical protein BWX70_00094 [Verrucomicrobia bacterium ADurb.Bin070]|nr:MAG: hypothetical protein BWX70_00094 [Verrucomicrobia bacterium ADurb.Bin070]